MINYNDYGYILRQYNWTGDSNGDQIISGDFVTKLPTDA